MSEHDNDTCPHLVRASLLEAENARLKTEVQHLMIFCNSTLIPSKELQEEIANLKAEVERLRKAGDAMADWFKYNDCRDCRNDFNGWMTQAWNAAKEGKPSV